MGTSSGNRSEIRAAHSLVHHPLALIDDSAGKFNNWIVDHLALALGSLTGLYLSFIIPLVAFVAHPLLGILGLVSSYWIQLWALFCLQRTGNRSQKLSEAKAEADHRALTHIALTCDEILKEVTK